MASARRTFDTDSITLRTVYAKNGNNTNIPALRALTADGSGGTYWSIPSSFGTRPSFNQIITDAGIFTADLSYNIFRLTSGEGIGMSAGPAGSNQTYIYAKAFGQVDVSGADSLYAYSNATVNPGFKIATSGSLALRTDPQRNTIFIDGPLTKTISSGYYGFSKVGVVPTISTFQANIPAYLTNYLFANSPSSQITFTGIGDVILSSFYSTNTVYFTVSSYTATDFVGMSTIANSLNSTITSTLNGQYVTKSDFSTGTGSVSTNSYSNASSVTSTIYGISSFFVTQFNILTGLINARALITQLNSNVNSFTTAISSFSTNYVSQDQYLSSVVGIPNQVSSVITISSISSLYFFGGTFYNFSTGSITYDQSDVSTLSTATGASISTSSNVLFRNIQGNYLSTFSTVNNLGSLGYVSSPSLTSTTRGLGLIGYLSSPALTSTVAGLGTFGYVSTSFLNTTLASTTKGLNDNFGSYGYISSLTLQSSLQSTTKGIIDSLGSLNYISTPSFNSTLQSTVRGVNNYLGLFGYISAPTLASSLASTVTGLGTIGYTSTSKLDSILQSTFLGFLRVPFISTASLTSTTNGLGTLGYLSTPSLVSTVSSLNLYLSTLFSTSLSLKSSIAYSGCNGSLGGYTDGNDLFFSTAYFSLDPFSTYIKPSSRILLDVNENLIFPPANAGYVGEIGTISSIVACDIFFMENTLINDNFLYRQSLFSNTYTKNLTMPLDTNFILGAYTSTFGILHRIPQGYGDSNVGGGGFIDSNLRIANSPLNSIFVTILN